MINLILMRHGETVWNAQHRTQGRRKNRLSEKGKIQAHEAGKQLQSKNIDVILCSPVFRTVQTANIVNNYIEKPLIKNNDLTEIDQGSFTGRLKNSLTEIEEQHRRNRSKEFGLECYDEVYKRVKNFL